MNNMILQTAFAHMASTAGVLANENEWPCFRGPNHDDKSPDRGPLKEWPTDGPAKLWQFTGLGKGFSTVAVSGGAIYTSGDVDGQMTMFALDMGGKLKWKTVHDKSWTRRQP